MGIVGVGVGDVRSVRYTPMTEEYATLKVNSFFIIIVIIIIE